VHVCVWCSVCCESSEYLDHWPDDQMVPGLVHITVCQIANFVCYLSALLQSITTYFMKQLL